MIIIIFLIGVPSSENMRVICIIKKRRSPGARNENGDIRMTRTYWEMRRWAAAFACLAFFGGTPGFAAEPPTREEMWRVIQRQQRIIDSLEQRISGTEKAVETTAVAVDKVANSGGGWWERTSVGGYGEVHYNGGDTDQLDLHRFVLFVGHEFNDRIRLATELEVEHDVAGAGQVGEVEVEQAYLEFDFSKRFSAKAGVFLIPVGILNEVHEPPTFYGVERNNVEKNIVPATWWEGGAALTARFQEGLSLDFAVHSGLKTPTAGGSAFKIRDGRQKAGKASAVDPAYTARLRWTGMPGVELAATAQYQADLTQSRSGNVSATLFEVHADVQREGFGLRALYARWDLDGGAPAAIGRDQQHGWYIEPSYKIATGAGDLGVFLRYSRWDNAAGDSTDSESADTSVGLNYWPHRDVVLKVDYQFDEPPAGTKRNDRVNLGVGFQY